MVDNTLAMEQLTLFNEDKNLKKDWILISLMPEYYQKVKLGIKKYEYRRGGFIKEPAIALVYSTVPDKKIGLLVEFGIPIYGEPEKIAQIKEQEERGSFNMMMEWLRGFQNCCAVPIDNVRILPEITLDEIRIHFPRFQPPQKFIYLKKNPALFNFLKERLNINDK